MYRLKGKSHWIVLVVCAVLVFCAFALSFEDIISKDIVSYGLALFVIVFLAFSIGLYIDKITGGERSATETRVEKDITKLFKKVFSLDGLFVVLAGVVVAIVSYLIKRGKYLGNTETQFLALTLSVTLATIIPSVISRLVTKNQLNEMIDAKIGKELEQFSISLYNIRRDKGHASRMSAALLEQLAEKEAIPGGNRQNREDNAAWAIGWASDAIIQYLLIRNRYENAIRNVASCVNILNKAASLIVANESVCIIKPQDLKSLLTMHALVELFDLAGLIESKVEIQRAKEKYEPSMGGILEYDHKGLNLITSLNIVEEYFYKQLQKEGNSSIDFAHFCTITGMPYEFNEELNKCAERIVDGVKQRVESINDNNE